MRILLLSGTSVYPYVDAAGCGTYNFLKILTLRHKIDLLQLCPSGPICNWPVLGPLDCSDNWLDRNFIRSWTVHRNGKEKVRYGFIQDFSNLQQVLSNINFDGYDIIWAHWINWAYFLSDEILSKTVMDYRDCYDLSYRRQLLINDSPYKHIKIIIKRLLYQYFAKRYLKPVNTFVMLSNKDANSVRSVLPKANVEVMAFGVDSGYFTPSREWVLRSDSPAIVFVGAMTAKHNCDAVIYFMNSILPIIRIEIPDIKMQIVGRAGDGSIRSLVSQAIGVEIFENVPDVRPYLWAASVFVAPMISGTGIKTKILEAWAASCAVVSTPMGCEEIR
jgi:glycosyltransferase involved in cell wall biosynthesis